MSTNLTLALAREFRALARRVSIKALAKRYTVDESVISRIISGRIWKEHIVATASCVVGA